MSALLACPCGSTDLRSDEVATVGYPVKLTRESDGTVGVEYTGGESITFDEGTVYSADIWCLTCGANIAEEALVPEKLQGEACPFEVITEGTATVTVEDVQVALEPTNCTIPCDGTGYTGHPRERCTTHYQPNDLSEFL